MKSLSLWSLIGFGAPSPDCDKDDMGAILKAVLPIFVAIAERALNNLPDGSSPSKTRKFYLDFIPRGFNLHAVLVQWNPTETIQRNSEDERTVTRNLIRVLDELENRFVPSKVEEAGRAYERLGFKRTQDETYPKLRALARTRPGNDENDDNNARHEKFLKDANYIIRIDRKGAAGRNSLLSSLERAFNFFRSMEPFKTESHPACPIRFLNYPLHHIRTVTETLFSVIQTNWHCQCRSSTSHVSRKTRLNLTQHQRFETTPTRGQVILNSEPRFRILFPTNSRDIEWQDTEITITKQKLVKPGLGTLEANNRLCEIIQGLDMGIRPRMAVYAQSLWERLADAEIDPSSPTHVHDHRFKSLKDLLRPTQKDRSVLSSIEGRDRLILSFILATSLLHFVDGPWLQARLSSENICFLVLNPRSPPDITKPYLTTSFAALPQPALPRDLTCHPSPDILSLGILLLEIARGTPIEFKDPPGRFANALGCMDEWAATCPTSCSATVPDGLRQAITACINPNQSGDFPDANDHNGFAVRKYIFERILYPLENALSTAYEIQSDTLHANIGRPKEVGEIGCFDHQDEHRREKQKAAEEWLRHLYSVHELFYDCQDRCDGLSEQVKKATRVKVAVLDTGLQLPGALQANYEADERINFDQSATFTEGGAAQEWKVDHDGHGSRVGQILLEVAPTVDLHVAKVFKTRNDLADPEMATQVQKRIGEAIIRATNEWKVDMIIMCFGFDELIPLIRNAIGQALKAEKPPLFFAATRNDGAHKRMAWPARDASVIGISSTTSDGSVSMFNPLEDNAHPIFYAFGEGVPVKVADPVNPDGFITKYVSGTSYATPVAAAMAANLLGCIRMLVETCPREHRSKYSHVPGDLQRMSDMLTVLRRHMQKRHVSGVESLIPWGFLKVELPGKESILKDVTQTLRMG